MMEDGRGVARVYVEAFGCSANTADAEIIRGLVKEAGYAFVASADGADAAIILTCIVKTPTEQKVVKRLREISALGLPLIVAGCMPKAEGWLVEKVTPSASLMGTNDILRVVEVLESTLGGQRVEALDGVHMDRSCLPRVRKNSAIHIAPIASGCVGSCSYCIVKRARGALHSFSANKIVEDARKALGEGCREIWVTAEDTAAYSWSGINLPQILGMLSGLGGRFYVRVGMMTPNEAEPMLDELLEAYGSEKVFKFLHLPVQSGNDEVLRRMGRRYLVEDFVDIVERFRKAFPDLGLSTDIICGFPGETEEQFQDSIRLVEDVKPDVLNISRFWPRPGTEAERMDGQLHGRETKRRSRILTNRWRKISLERNLRWLGWSGEMLVDEPGINESLVGRNFAYKAIALRSSARMGEFVKVRVTGAREGYLIGEIL